MKHFFALAFILFYLSACQCGCDTIDYTPPENYNSSKSSFSIYADGCAMMDGSINSIDQTPNGSCDNVGEYVNRGRWVQAPNIQAVINSNINIGINGSIFFCSVGYDNYNPTPTINVKPASPVNNIFNGGYQFSVNSGEMIVLSITDSTGIKLSPSAVSTCTAYPNFNGAACIARNGFGLSIYIDNNEIVTLDNTQNSSNLYNYNSYLLRNPLLMVYTSPNSRYTTNALYSFTQAEDQSKYFFMVPSGMSGKLGFAIFNGQKSSLGTSTNQSYVVNVYNAPGACLVDSSQVTSIPGSRGAVQMLVTASNPNNVDNVISLWSSLNSTAMTSYYQSLLNYVNSFNGISISSNQQVLSDLVISSAPNLSPIIITDSNYSFVSNATGSLWFKVLDDYYHDNLGKYDISVQVLTRKNSTVSKFLVDLTKPVQKQIDISTRAIYQNFSYAQFTNIIRLCLLLYVMFYGASFMLGLTHINALDVLIRSIKIGVMRELLKPNSWDFFNNYLFKLFTDGSESLVSFVSGDYTQNKDNIFNFVDDIFNIFFASGTWMKLVSLMPTFIGIILMLIIIFVMAFYVMTLLRVLMAYLLAMVMVSILISLAPIFLVLILFERTKKHFDNWIKYLADYALQPVLMLSALYILNAIFLQLWNNAMNYGICWGDLVTVGFSVSKMLGINNMPSITIGCIKFPMIKGGLSLWGLFASIFQLLAVCFAIGSIINSIPEITAAITGAYGAATGITKLGDTTLRQGVSAMQNTATFIASKSKLLKDNMNMLKEFSKRSNVSLTDPSSEDQPASNNNDNNQNINTTSQNNNNDNNNQRQINQNISTTSQNNIKDS